jgi:hypothetical protein
MDGLQLMAWNWQQPDWPHFRWDADSLKQYETQFLHNVGMQIGSTKHFDEVTRQLVLVDMLTGPYWSQVAALI